MASSVAALPIECLDCGQIWVRIPVHVSAPLAARHSEAWQATVRLSVDMEGVPLNAAAEQHRSIRGHYPTVRPSLVDA